MSQVSLTSDGFGLSIFEVSVSLSNRMQLYLQANLQKRHLLTRRPLPVLEL